MTATVLEMKNIESEDSIRIITNAIKNEFVSVTTNGETSNTDCEKVVRMTALSVKKFANIYYKKSEFLEISDIEQIKDSLKNYANKDSKVSEFKKVIIDDLTAFQQQIKTNYVQRLTELGKQKQDAEKQIRVMDFEKNKLVMERLSRIVWPYDQTTKEYDSKIAKLQMQVEKYTQQIEDLKQMRPVANEKDILLYQINFKNKFQTK